MKREEIVRGDFPVNTIGYESIYEFPEAEHGSRRELLWRLLLRETYQEGMALDVDAARLHEFQCPRDLADDEIVLLALGAGRTRSRIRATRGQTPRRTSPDPHGGAIAI